MSGTVWPSLVAGARAKASEVESKFNWIEGDFLPFNAGTQTDDTYDLGSVTINWVDGWFKGRVHAGAGSTGNCSFSRQDDTANGVYFPAADELGLVTAGAAAVRIDSSQNIGIGATSMTDMVEITRNQDALTALQITNTNNTASADCALELKSAVTNGDPYIHFDIAGSTQITMGIDNSDGNQLKVSGAATLGTTDLITVEGSGEINKPLQPSFLASNSVADANVTGDNTVATVEFDSEIYDQSSDYDNTTDTFTAPKTGRYLLLAIVDADGMDYAGGSHSRSIVRIVTSNRSYESTWENNGWSNAQGDERGTFNVSVIADMDTSDTAIVQIEVLGAAKTVDVQKAWFSGSLLN